MRYLPAHWPSVANQSDNHLSPCETPLLAVVSLKCQTLPYLEGTGTFTIPNNSKSAASPTYLQSLLQFPPLRQVSLF